MARPNEGRVDKSKDGTWWARVRWTGEDGKAMDFKRVGFPTKADALEWRDKTKAQLRDKGTKVMHARNIRFGELAEEYQKRRLTQAVIRNGQKISGVLGDYRYNLKALVQYFGPRKLQEITNDDLIRYREARFTIKTKHGRERSVASINRELQLARAMFNYAIGKQWLTVSPFKGGNVIKVSAENQRNRVLTPEELERLFDACRRPDLYGRNSRRRLYPLVLAAVHTAARRRELTQLRWRDVDWSYEEYGAITVTSRKGVTIRPRLIPLSPTLRGELWKLWEESTKGDDELVFGYKWGATTAYRSALREAGISDFTFHDLRHLATTMMVERAENPFDVMQLTGHTQESTFRRYYNPREKRLAAITAALG